MTDSEKWDKRWFRTLSPNMKLMWLYICDSCDAAGIWSEDIELASFKIGIPIDEAEYLETLGSKFTRIEKHKIFVPNFVEFQYGELSKECKPHVSVIKNLTKHSIDPKTLTLTKGLHKGIQTLKDKDKDKDKEKEKEQEKEKAFDLRDDIERCKQVWLETLRHFKAGRTNLLPMEDSQIGRAIQAYGSNAVAYALIGVRLQKKSDTYDPSQNLNLTNIFKPEAFQRYMNLGIAGAQKPKAATQTVVDPSQEPGPQSPPRTFNDLLQDIKKRGSEAMKEESA